MEKQAIYELIQKKLSSTPLILIGTGGTMPYGIPGMEELAQRLQKKLTPKYGSDKEWIKFLGRLSKGIGLEDALTDLNLSSTIVDSIISETWELVNEADLKLMEKWLNNGTKLALGEIVHKYYQSFPQCVNIITTNYDRGIEYACDQYGILVNVLFEGEYFKRFNRQKRKNKGVNLLKVHGSLDWYYRDNKQVISIPLQKEIHTGMTPAIVTPGISKYQRVLETPFRDIVHIADELIENAKCFLCIGYGFNDSQIQTNIIREIQLGKSIVVWTKRLSDSAIKLIEANSRDFIIVQALENDDNKTEILLPSGKEIIDEILWTQEGFLKII